jgi:hypothetical protein
MWDTQYYLVKSRTCENLGYANFSDNVIVIVTILLVIVFLIRTLEEERFLINASIYQNGFAIFFP